MARYIFVTGGVVSSLGKGLSSASLAYLLQSRGYKVRIRKLDPYLNVDPGTMSPFQHGEVFVTDDGAETDLDLGHYERFSGISAKKSDNITTGRIYNDVLKRERQGKYLGKTVQVIPHITNRIKEFIKHDVAKEDFVICEIGGTVGDIESLPFLEAIRQFSNEFGRRNTLQGSCANFENILLFQYLNNNASTILLEDESRTIGKATLPNNWYSKMQASRLVVLDIQMEERIENIFEEYIEEEFRKLNNEILLKKKLKRLFLMGYGKSVHHVKRFYLSQN